MSYVDIFYYIFKLNYKMLTSNTYKQTSYQSFLNIFKFLKEQYLCGILYCIFKLFDLNIFINKLQKTKLKTFENFKCLAIHKYKYSLKCFLNVIEYRNVGHRIYKKNIGKIDNLFINTY